MYFIGPDAEFLESAPAYSGNPQGLVRKMKTALDRWAKLRKKKKYANRKVPEVRTFAPPEVADKNFVMRVFLRDLPRGRGDDSGRRYRKADQGAGWMNFIRWAWNVNWITFDDPRAFVTRSDKERPVPAAVATRIAREVLVDNVRGQNPHWRPEHVEKVELTVRRVEVKKGIWHLAYRGEASMKSDRQSYQPKLVGRAQWNPKKRRFESFELVAIGPRQGAGRFNQRRRDPGPAPMGIALVAVRKPDEQKAN